MYHLPHYSVERTLFVFWAGLAIGALTVIVLFAIVKIWAIKRDLDERKKSSNSSRLLENSISNEYYVYVERGFYTEPGEMVVFERKPKLGEQTILPSTGERVEVCSIDQNIVVKPISDYLEKQAELFDRQLPELLPKYKGMYVFFEDGEVKDADLDEEALINRVLAKEGYRDIFVEKVI